MLHIDPQNVDFPVPWGTRLMDALQAAGIYLDAPCGGNGTCGKCRVMVDGEAVLSCQRRVDRDMTVTVPGKAGLKVLQTGIAVRQKMNPIRDGHLLAFDIGTTSVVDLR